MCLPLTPEEARTQQIKLQTYFAIWDTGATNSAITSKVVSDLGLQPTGVVEVRHAKGKSLTNTYLINIVLPTGVMVGQVRVTEVELVSDDGTPENQCSQILVGMDIIGMGDFAVTNFNGKTVMSFRTPSIAEIDFVPEAKDNNIMEGGNRQQRRALNAKKRRGPLLRS